MTTVIESIEQADYDISNEQLKEMLTIKSSAGKVEYVFDDSYFKILYTRWALQPGTSSVNDLDMRLNALNKVAKPMKQLVNKVYIGPDITPCSGDTAEEKKAKTKKRQSITKFADTAKAELKAAIINEGVDILGKATKGAYQVYNQGVRDAIRASITPENAVINRFNTAMDALSKLNEQDTSAASDVASYVVDGLRAKGYVV